MPTENLPHGADLRKGCFSEPGRVYLVTAVTHERGALFAEFHAARALIRELRACDEAGRTLTFAFVIMPDHVHWLFQLNWADLSAVVQRVKSHAAIRLNRMADMNGRRVWQRGFHDHALRDEEDVRGAARMSSPIRCVPVSSNPSAPIRIGMRFGCRRVIATQVAWPRGSQLAGDQTGFGTPSP